MKGITAIVLMMCVNKTIGQSIHHVTGTKDSAKMETFELNGVSVNMILVEGVVTALSFKSSPVHINETSTVAEL